MYNGVCRNTFIGKREGVVFIVKIILCVYMHLIIYTRRFFQKFGAGAMAIILLPIYTHLQMKWIVSNTMKIVLNFSLMTLYLEIN